MNIPVLFLKYLELKLNTRLSPEGRATRRLAKFRRFAAFVHRHSAYYARIMEKNGIDCGACVPTDFPVLTKRLLMDHFDEIATTRAVTREKIAAFLAGSQDPCERYAGNHVVLHTSGSSGEIGYFVYSASDWARGYAQLHRLHPFSFRSRSMAYFGATQGHFAGITLFMTSQCSILKPFFRPVPFEINGPLQPVLDRLNALQPDILAGYPSGLLMLAGKQLDGDLNIAPSFIETGGEPLTTDARRVIGDTFKAPVLDLYASTEHMLMAISQPGRGGMNLLEDDLIFETHTDHICVTNLFNRTLPLIRYRMDDVLNPLSAPDTALPFRRVHDLVGRMEQAPVFLNRYGSEDFISPIIMVEFHVRNLRRFQIRVTGKTSFQFRAMLEKDLGQAAREKVLLDIRAKMETILKQKELDNVIFSIEEVDDLPVDPVTGKFRLIVY